MRTIFVIQHPDGTPFQRDDAMGILATDSEAQAIRFAGAREDEGAEYVRYTTQPPHQDRGDVTEALRAAYNCICELRPTQARAEVLELLTTALSQDSDHDR